jgi:H+/Cl- antiporter ClcA
MNKLFLGIFYTTPPFTKFSPLSDKLQTIKNERRKEQMNIKVKLAVFWGVMITTALVGINFFLHLIGGHQNNVVFQQGFRPEGRGHHGGKGTHPFMNGPHHGGDFSWFGLLLFLIVGLALLVLIVKWVRRRAKNSAMQQFIDTSVAGSHIPIINQNVIMLDQWEKSITKKENN